MYGNTPNAGRPGTGDRVDLSAEQRRGLCRDLASVAVRTQGLLPEGFDVGFELTDGLDGPQATVTVRPPVGPVVRAGVTPTDSGSITDEHRDDLAHGAAASAALQVKQALADEISPTAR